MKNEQREALRTPKYGSYDILRPSKGFTWPYKWQPTLAIFVQGIVTFGSVYIVFEVYHLGTLLTVITSAVACFIIGFLYNVLAKFMKWQKMHWLDFLPGIDPMIYP